jgi:hypothetical protein
VARGRRLIRCHPSSGVAWPRRTSIITGQPRALWRHRLTPCWKRISGAVTSIAVMDDLIGAVGFQVNAGQNRLHDRPEALDFHL